MPDELEYEGMEMSLIKYHNQMSILKIIKNLFKKILKKSENEQDFIKGDFVLLKKENKDFFKGPYLEEFDKIETRFNIKDILLELNNMEFKNLYIQIIDEFGISGKPLQEDKKDKILSRSDEFEKDISDLNKKYYNIVKDYYEIKKVKTSHIAFFISDLAFFEEKLLKKAIFYYKNKIKGLEKLNYIEEQNSINIDYYKYIKKVDSNTEEINIYSKKIEEYDRKKLMYIQMHKYFSNILLEENIKLYDYFDIYIDNMTYIYKNYRDKSYEKYINLFNEIFKSYINYINEYCNKNFKNDNMMDYANCYMSIGEGNILNKEQEDIINYIYDLNKK